MEEESIGKSNGTIKEVSNDAQGFDWQTGEQQTASKYLRPAKLPEKSSGPKSKYLKDPDHLVDIKPVKRLGTIEVRKPKPQEWFRTHSHPGMFREMFVIENSSGDFYAVDPAIASEFSDVVREAYVTAAINDEGALFLWVIPKPKADGSGAQLYDSNLEDLSLSRGKWIRRQWDRGSKSYKVDEATTEKEPAWPENCNFEDWMDRGFKNRFIDDVDHPILRRARGEL